MSRPVVASPLPVRSRWLPFPGARRVLASTMRTVAGAMACVALAACGGGGSDQPTGPGAVTRVTVSVSSLTMNVIGGSEAVSATARDANGAVVPSATFTWSSDNTTIATVTATGSNATITARGPGSTTVRATSGGFSAEVAVQVLGVRAIQVSPTAATIRVGDFQSFSTTFDADPGVSRAVTWSVDNPVVASVNSFGDVTGIATGTATVRATSVADPRISSTATITVTPARSVVVSPATATMATAETRTLTATVSIEQGQSTAVTWRSSAPAVATVSSAGLVRAVAFGTTTITAVSVADTMLRGTASISVVPVIRTVSVAPATATLNTGNTQQLTSTVVAEGSLATTVTWRTSNATIATVSGTGLVTAVAVGSASITAVSTVDTTKRATSAITVAPRPVSVAIVQRVVNLNPGGSTTLNATVSADPGVSTAVTWTSATPSVATISQAGVVNAVAAGATLVTATSVADNTKRDTVTVNVVPRLATTWSASRLNGVLYDDLVSIVAFNPTNAFAINSINGGASGGDIYRWNGAAWTLSASGSAFNTRFLSVHGNSATNAIAVGTNGVIARWNGTAWTAMTSGSTRTLRSVWVDGDASAFAVGDNGTALRLTGTTWTATSTGVTAQLNGIWSNAGTAYAVGAGGMVLAFNGTAWTRQTVPFSDDLNAVCGVVGGPVTAVGNFGGILRFDGTSWTLVNSNGVVDNFYAVNGTAANANRMYIGGDNGVYQLNGTVLTSASAPYPVSTFAVHVDFSGVTWTAGQRGAVQRLTGGTWEVLNFAPDLLDVWTTGSSNAWAVGEYGFVYRWAGTTWTRQATPSLATLYAVWAPSATESFAGGDNGTMLRYNGTAWTAMTFPSTARVFAIWGSSPTNVFAATDVGELLRYNGTTWAVQATAPGSATLLALHGVSASEVYATGTGGLVMRYNGTNWSTFTGPDAVSTLFGVWMTGSNSIVSVGANQAGTTGFAFNYNGTAWAPMSLGSPKALTSVWGPSIFDLYVTGDQGTMMRYNGSAWQTITTGTTDLLWAVTGAPDASGGAFAVGINSTIVAGSGGSAVMAGFARLAAPSRGSLEPSAAALRDGKASGAAAKGAARRNRVRLSRGDR